jgi:hypothetical protein
VPVGKCGCAGSRATLARPPWESTASEALEAQRLPPRSSPTKHAPLRMGHLICAQRVEHLTTLENQYPFERARFSRG